jgi:hypothetical protein
LFFIINEKEKEKTKVTYGEPEKGHMSWNVFHGKGFHLTDMIFFGKCFHLIEKHTPKTDAETEPL